ncbi:MAG: host-nuclease inhibitor Gam family protein [Nitrospirae bacterium]|nr:host-nuclease inhibitor Gam family protein [Nitrospirota bacterium]
MRVQPKDSIKTRAEAETALSRLNAIDTQLAAWELAEASAIAEVREAHTEVQKQGRRDVLEAEKTLIIKDLERWAEADVLHWEKKTLETPFGKLGFRTSTPAVMLIKKVVRNFAEALNFLSARMAEYVREAPEIDKEAILADARQGTLDIDTLAQCGLKVDQKEEFWIETAASENLEEAAKKLRAA